MIDDLPLYRVLKLIASNKNIEDQIYIALRFDEATMLK
ncbi:hypothetical protein NIES4102_31590 [Chondrocystis sp. NIES-4102]|nr:hypothetical protein NIES4102_31590 [Chondrocystis sp. NIES-4102]